MPIWVSVPREYLADMAGGYLYMSSLEAQVRVCSLGIEKPLKSQHVTLMSLVVGTCISGMACSSGCPCCKLELVKQTCEYQKQVA